MNKLQVIDIELQIHRPLVVEIDFSQSLESFRKSRLRIRHKFIRKVKKTVFLTSITLPKEILNAKKAGYQVNPGFCKADTAKPFSRLVGITKISRFNPFVGHQKINNNLARFLVRWWIVWHVEKPKIRRK
jgi:hypothetical protein